MLWAALLLLLGAPERPFHEERFLLDRRLETLRRILPDGPIAVADAALVKELAEQARLLSVESLARPPAESGARGHVAVDLTAIGSFAQIDRFFGQVALSHRLIDVESLSMTAAPGDAIRLTTVLLCPFRPLRAPLPQVPDGTRAKLGGVPRPQADAFVADQALALAKSEAIAALRRARRNPRVFLSELGAAVRERPAIVTQAVLGDEFSVKGLTVGEGPLRALESRFERGFFRVTHFLVARQGACLRFEVRGTSPIAGPEAELPIPGEDPFEEPDGSCAVDRDTLRGPVVQAPTGKAPGKGPLTLRLRDVDLPDVFKVLAALTGQGFLVDATVFGRTSLELTRVTLDEAQQAVGKAAGLRFEDSGPVRRVATGRGDRDDKKGASGKKAVAAESPRAAAGPLVSVELKRAPLRDLLAVMAEIDPSLASLGPPGALGRFSVWIKDAPAAVLRDAMLAAASLTERLEDGRRIVERAGATGEGAEPIAGDPTDPRLQLRPSDLALSEFQPAGVATSGNGWMAFAYAPSGTLYAYRPGDHLADAIVKGVESTDVVLETDEGDLRVPVAPLPR
ncbi:MAG TPA: hypothetical protein VFM88_00180 [Vicinamibacteria bacterium]|nr:hypothetical protein [Vicinamibacteria bacterium]